MSSSRRPRRPGRHRARRSLAHANRRGARPWPRPAGAAGPRRGARRADAEELEAVALDPVAGAPPDRAGDALDPRIVDLLGPAAARADQVMVVSRLAGHVGVLAGRQVEPFDQPELLEQVERPEDRRPSDPQPAGARVGDEIGGGEVAAALGDELGHRAARRRHPVPGIVQRSHERLGLSHRQMIPSLSPVVETQSQLRGVHWPVRPYAGRPAPRRPSARWAPRRPAVGYGRAQRTRGV